VDALWLARAKCVFSMGNSGYDHIIAMRPRISILHALLAACLVTCALPARLAF